MNKQKSVHNIRETIDGTQYKNEFFSSLVFHDQDGALQTTLKTI